MRQAKPSMSEAPRDRLRETEAQILTALDRFLKAEVEPHVMALEDADEYPGDIVEGMKEMGLFGCVVSEEHGGLGLPVTIYVRIVERICETWMSLSGIINTHLLMAWIVEKFGTAEQRASWLPKFASGEIRGGLALTEPGCGTDLQAIATRAVRDGADYVISGTKTWITNGYHGDCVALLVKTDMEAEPRHRGISLFLAQKGEGFTASRKLRKLGYRGIDTAELVFEDFRIPHDRLIGGKEGRGLKQALGALELGRINVAARGVGLARRALDLAVSYARQRQTFGTAIANHQAIQIKLADMATRLEASRHLTWSAAAAFDAGERCDMEAGMAKLHASETALFNATESMRIHGAYGYSREFEIERLYRDAPLLVIGEGTNELQRIIIARQLVARHSG